MAHCPFNQLTDLTQELNQIRKWENMKEPQLGVFYFKNKPFLHFHIKDGIRWADARCGLNWGPSVDIPLSPTVKMRKTFMSNVQKCYEETVSALVKKSKK